jgi:hypothetical protein
VSGVWNGKPISSLDTAHIQRILEAAARGTWSSGKPCFVPPTTAQRLREELERRIRQEMMKVQLEQQRIAFEAALEQAQKPLPPLPKPVPPPPPWKIPAPAPLPSTKYPTWVESAAAEVDRITSAMGIPPEMFTITPDKPAAAEDPDRWRNQYRRAQRLNERLEKRINELGDEVARLRRELRDKERQARSQGNKLKALARAAKSYKLDELDDQALLSWWHTELADWPGYLGAAFRRVVVMASEGLGVKGIRPRKIKRPGIGNDEEKA